MHRNAAESITATSKLVRKPAACEFLAIAPATLDRLVRAGRLPRYKLGSNTSAYRLSDLEAFVESTLQNGGRK